MSDKAYIREAMVRLAVTTVLGPGHLNEDGSVSVCVRIGTKCFELVLHRRDADELAVGLLAATDPHGCERPLSNSSHRH